MNTLVMLCLFKLFAVGYLNLPSPMSDAGAAPRR